MKKQEFFYNVHAILRDIHHISEIEDITALPSSKSENGGEISIKYDRGKSTMVLASAQRDVILAVSIYKNIFKRLSDPCFNSIFVIASNDMKHLNLI